MARTKLMMWLGCLALPAMVAGCVPEPPSDFSAEHLYGMWALKVEGRWAVAEYGDSFDDVPFHGEAPEVTDTYRIWLYEVGEEAHLSHTGQYEVYLSQHFGWKLRYWATWSATGNSYGAIEELRGWSQNTFIIATNTTSPLFGPAEEYKMKRVDELP